jgi:hypothetical protein
MRQFIVRSELSEAAVRFGVAGPTGSVGATGPTGPTGQYAVQGCAIQTYTNDSTASSIQQCGHALLLSDPNLSQSISTIFKTVFAAALAEAGTGAEDALAVWGAVEVFSSISATAAYANIISSLVNLLAGYIGSLVTTISAFVSSEVAAAAASAAAASAIAAGSSAAEAAAAGAAAGAAAEGSTDIAVASTSIAAGASSFGYVGAIIGFIIGATIAIANYLNPHSVETTYGVTVAGVSYIQTNLTNAAQWLQNQTSVAGMTPQYFAVQQSLFLANPTWLWANQALTGMCQPIPPEQGSGSTVDFIFTQCPGAFELLSRAQFGEAAFNTALTPSKLMFYMSIVKPTGTVPTAQPTNNPNNYNPIWSQADLYGNQAWTPDNPDSDVTFSEGGILNPDTEGLNWSWGPANPQINPVTINSEACTGNNNPATQADTQTQPTSSNPSYGGRGYAAYYYSSCPNLVTNNNSVNSDGSMGPQTDIAEGIYNLQVIYPALTTNQCLCIFNANFQAYLNWIAAAKEWANSRCEYPDAIHLGTGSTWNLETADVQAIQAQWVAPANCPGSKASAATATVQTTLKTTALVGGAAAMGLAFYAYKNGMTVTTAAKSLFGTALKAAKGLI